MIVMVAATTKFNEIIEGIELIKKSLPENLQAESNLVSEAFNASVIKQVNEKITDDADFIFEFALKEGMFKMSLEGRVQFDDILKSFGMDTSEPFMTENIFTVCSALMGIDKIPGKIVDENSRKEVENCIRELKSEFSGEFKEGFVEGICEAIA